MITLYKQIDKLKSSLEALEGKRFYMIVSKQWESFSFHQSAQVCSIGSFYEPFTDFACNDNKNLFYRGEIVAFCEEWLDTFRNKSFTREEIAAFMIAEQTRHYER